MPRILLAARRVRRADARHRRPSRSIRATSLIDDKQLVLLRDRARRLSTSRAANARDWSSTSIVSVGAASAAFGIIQCGLLHYDNLGRRPQGTLGTT